MDHESNSVHAGPEVRYVDLPFAPGYRVGDDGSVWSKRKQGRGVGFMPTWRKLRPGPDSFGYPTVALCIEGRPKTFRVHRLVLESFSGPQPVGCEALHSNGIKTDARASNLRWGTRSENMQDAKKHGTIYRGAAQRRWAARDAARVAQQS